MSIVSERRIDAAKRLAAAREYFAAEELSVKSETRPGRGQIVFAAVLSALLIVGGAACTPVASLPLAPVPGFMTAFGAGMFVINALLAALLLGKGSIERRADVTKLGAAYFFVAAIFVPLTLSFKDGFVPGTLIGTPATSVWLWSAWHAGFGLAISWYALEVNSVRPAPSIQRISIVILGLVAAISLMTTLGVNFLPTLLWNGKTFFSGALNCIPVTLIAIDLVALALCLRLMARTTEHLWVTVAMVAACFDLWLTVHGANRFALGWYLSKCGSVITSFVVIASLFYDITRVYRNSAVANRVLTDLASRDGLTGVRNRRYFDGRLEEEWRRAMFSRKPLSILMMDVDHFKQFNDLYGHVAGDDCLRLTARALNDALVDPASFVARYGGEEFVALLPGIDATEALSLAEALRRSVQALAIPHKSSATGWLTTSIGVSTRVPTPEGAPHALLRNADSALYLAKNRGRNQIVSSIELSRGGVPEKVALERTA